MIDILLQYYYGIYDQKRCLGSQNCKSRVGKGKSGNRSGKSYERKAEYFDKRLIVKYTI